MGYAFSSYAGGGAPRPFARPSGGLVGSQARDAANAGWTNSWGDTWTNSAKPGQYLSSNSLRDLLTTRSDFTQRNDPNSYNPGIDYMSVVAPYLQQAGQALNNGPASVNESNEYEDSLKALMANPNSIADSGSYKFAFDQGQQALERSAAARGMTGSGNVLAELTKYGQGMASQQYNTEADRLAGLAGGQKNYILGMKGLANQEYGNKSQNYMAMANTAMNAAQAKASDYWNAQNTAYQNAMGNGYMKQQVW